MILSKAKDYYKDNEERLKEKERNKHRNLSEEEKNKKENMVRIYTKICLEKKKQRLKEYRKNYYKTKKSQYNNE